MKTITLHKGGTAEKMVPLSEVKVPDMWHIAQYFQSNVNAPLTDTECVAIHDRIMEIWHLAHAMKQELDKGE